MISAAVGMTLRGREVCAAISIEEKDFHAMFDDKERTGTARWKWAMNEAPDKLCNTIPEYVVSTKNRAAYEEELQMWIDNGWLISYPQEQLGPPKGLIPLMAIEQPTKDRIQPVMD